MRTLLALLFTSLLAFGASNPRVLLQTTQGDVTLELYPNVAPMAVENFTTHVKNGYYNGLTFHRIIKNFMIQGGDPTGTGAGGESIWKKPFKDEFKSGVVFDKAGILAMANAGPRTNGSQFFITTAPTPWLNGYHTIFGRVVQGMDTIAKLNNIATNGQRGGDRPLQSQKILKATLLP
ncbi:MAG: peptidylprolyl isomerase [Sulfuricurvum sp. MLSB]|uniref:peptidylprolyl isomerase n=1 Tax=unclassified Sulfuricurvum TaxID=2632390 RepID=UPI000506AC8C|nr:MULTISPECIES: peptidylprolyl isomerase [unclassified Sulfuricurvum]KFN38844.1 MAG: peptidylprolyl isomerase [Sulfuricurvum sp. MLSB]